MENLNEMQNEMVEKTVEEVAETQESAVEEIVEEMVEEMVEEPAEEIVFDEEVPQEPKKGINALLVTIIVMGVVIAGLLAYAICDIIADRKANILNADSLFEYYEINKNESEKIKKDAEKNKDKYTEFYNNLGYANVSGMTIKDFCKEQGVDFETLRAQYNLPVTLTEDVYFDVVQYILPVSANIDPKLLKENFGVSEIEVDGKKYPVTADMPFGLVYDEIALIKLVGEDGFEDMKAEYGFGDEVNEKTKMKDVREKMEKVDIQKRIEEEKAAAAEEEATDEMSEEELMAALEAAAAEEAAAE